MPYRTNMDEQPTLCGQVLRVYTPNTQPPVGLPGGLGVLSVLESVDSGRRPA